MLSKSSLGDVGFTQSSTLAGAFNFSPVLNANMSNVQMEANNFQFNSSMRAMTALKHDESINPMGANDFNDFKSNNFWNMSQDLYPPQADAAFYLDTQSPEMMSGISPDVLSLPFMAGQKGATIATETAAQSEREIKPRRGSESKICKTTRKYRRKSRAQNALPVETTSDSERREELLERNRQAATKCRQKKKEWVTDLEERARELSTKRQMLTSMVTMLKNELLMLKCKCLEHSDCGCEEIRDYLKETIRNLKPGAGTLYNDGSYSQRGSVSTTASTGDGRSPTMSSTGFRSPTSTKASEVDDALDFDDPKF